MYEQHFGLTERPFSIAPDPRFLYMSPQHREALAHLLYGVGPGGGFVQLTGEVGTGKTTMCRCLVEQLPNDVDVALILNPRVSGLELVASLCDELKIDYPKDTGSIKVLTDALNAYLLKSHADGRHTVLIIDEAQCLTAEALEQVRLLTNLETTREKLLQIVLVGQPELRDLLALDSLRQLAQRITARYHLLPISREETGAYIHHRLQVCGASDKLFTEGGIDRVHRLSQGIPRLINILCDRAMLGAFAEGRHVIDTAIVRRAAREVLPDQQVARPKARKWPWMVAAALLLALGAGAFLNRDRLQQIDWVALFQSSETAVVAQPPASGPGPLASADGDLQAGPVVPATDAAEANRPARPSEAGPLLAASSDPADPDAPPGEAPPIEPMPTEVPQTESVEPLSAALEPVPSGVSQPTGPAGPERTVAEAMPPEPPAPEPPVAASAPPEPAPVETLAASAPLPEPEPPLAALLEGSGPRAAAQAWAGLYRLWGYESEAVTDVQACAQAPAAGLHCMQASGSWGILQRFDRPAILLLVSTEGRWVPVLLRQMVGERVVLAVGEQALEVSRRELERHWYGEYRLLWKTPPTGVTVLRPGRSSSDVEWLRERLARIVGDTAAVANPRYYDTALKSLVEAFQREHGLTADGVAGARTFILLNNRDAPPDVPRLKAPPAGVSE